MTRQEKFEAYYAPLHEVPASSLVQYRFKDQDGYSLPAIASAYRHFCGGMAAEPDYLAARAEARKILPMVPVDILDDLARAVLGSAR